MLINCKYCNSTNLIRTQREFSDQSKHIEVRCGDCERWLMWESHVTDEDFTMPFGKHEGMKLTDIIDKHYSYVMWFIDHSNMKTKKNIKAKFQRLLKANPKVWQGIWRMD